MYLNKIVAYENQGKSILGWVQTQNTKKFEVLNEFNQVIHLTEDRFYLFQSPDYPKNINELNKIYSMPLPQVELELLWENTETESIISLKDLCLSYFSELAFLNELSLRKILLEKNPYFKREEEGFSKRSLTAVETYKKQLAVESENELVDQEFCNYIKGNSELKEEQSQMKTKLLQYISGAILNTNDLKRIKNIITKIKHEENSTQDLEIFAYNYLLKKNIIDDKFNPIVHRYKINLNYPVHNFEHESGELLSDQCFTIDDASTQDMDDAFSLEQTNSGFKLGIYISNVAKYIDLDSEIGRFAARTASSIYSIEKNYDMLPKDLSEDFLSLVPGHPRHVIALILNITSNYKILSHELKHGTIIVKEKLSYEETDKRLENEDFTLNTLYRIAVNHEAIRLDKGAFQSNRVAPKVYFENDILKMGIYDETNPSRVLVSELMIISNNYFAKYAVENKLKTVFRIQSAPEEVNINLDDYPDGVVRDYYSKTGLKPSKNTFSSSSHWGLGLDTYIQATSPIRRYLDLYNQTLIYKKLLGEPYNFEVDLSYVEEKLSNVNSVQRESERYWLLTYLKNLKVKETSGIVMKIDRIGCLVFIEEFYTSFFAKFTKKPKIGDTVKLKVNKINPFDLEIRLEF